MKRALLFCFAMFSIIYCHALGVTYHTQLFDGKTYLILRFEYDNDKIIPDHLIVKFYLNDGSDYNLEGDMNISTIKNNSNQGVVIKDQSIDHFFKFEITPDIMKTLEKGLKGVAINTMPEVYKERFSKAQSDKIIKSLQSPKENDILK